MARFFSFRISNSKNRRPGIDTSVVRYHHHLSNSKNCRPLPYHHMHSTQSQLYCPTALHTVTMPSPHTDAVLRRGRSHRSRSRSNSRERDGSEERRHPRSKRWSSYSKHQSTSTVPPISPPPTLLNLPLGVLPEDMHPNSILTNPVVAKLLHSLSSPNQIQHSLDEFCNEVGSEGGVVHNVIGDLIVFLKRHVKNERLK